MAYITTENGTDIYFKKFGNGPTALLIHPYLLDSTVWTVAMSELSKHRTCIAVDIPGHGLSNPLVHSDLDPHRDAETLFEVLDSIGIDEKFDIVGLAAGGIIGSIMATTKPEKINTLTLLSTIFFKPDNDAIAAVQQQLAGITLTESRDVLFRLFDSYITGPSASLEARARYKSMISACRYETIIALFTGNALKGRPDLPEKLSMPVLFPFGKSDSGMKPDSREKLVGDVKNATFVGLNEGGRLLPLEAPQEMNRAIVNFWQTSLMSKN